MKKSIKKWILPLSMLLMLGSCESCEPDPILPTVTTTDISAVAQTTATSGGNVTDDGGADVTARGVCWSTTASPTITNSKTSDGTGVGIFSSSMSGLVAGATYFVRAYATNSVGTSYGSEVTFKATPNLPLLTTTAVTSITTITAASGGNISSDGGGPITARGVCWNTASSPTISNSKTSDGTGTGNFTSSITGLTSGAIYYVRAYATNSTGTSYGNEVTFTALAIPATLITTAVTSIGSTTAVSGGNITSAGGGIITARGVCWNTAAAPTTANSKTTDGTGTGSFTSNITNLAPNTTYYLRAYATNSAGTGYGNEFSFKTNALTVSDVDGNVYNTVTIGTQVWMAENLKVTKYRNGDAIPNVSNDVSWKSLTSGAYCDWGNNISNGVTYGHLYNFYTVVDSRQLCPTGWRVPTEVEWKTLDTFLGGEYLANFKLREAGTLHWPSPNTATNETGFTALPGGVRDSNGVFTDHSPSIYFGFWWSTTTAYSNTAAWIRQMSCENCVQRGNYSVFGYGISVRCIKN